eukprot:749400-Hanusia_phi.AAC.1
MRSSGEGDQCERYEKGDCDIPCISAASKSQISNLMQTRRNSEMKGEMRKLCLAAAQAAMKPTATV